MEKHFPIAGITIVILLIISLVSCEQKCSAKGGQLVRGIFGLVCIVPPTETTSKDVK